MMVDGDSGLAVDDWQIHENADIQFGSYDESRKSQTAIVE
jgi:hypothetical protein